MIGWLIIVISENAELSVFFSSLPRENEKEPRILAKFFLKWGSNLHLSLDKSGRRLQKRREVSLNYLRI